MGRLDRGSQQPRELSQDRQVNDAGLMLSDEGAVRFAASRSHPA